jgi:hypothetical protein
MNVIRCTVIDKMGGVSFLTHGDALPALVKACASNPATVTSFLDAAEPYYHEIADYVLTGIAVFDEHNTRASYDAIHKALTTLPRHKQPTFRIVDALTREASLRPVKAGLVIFNLRARRIVQMVNSYREIRRTGRARVFDGRTHTDDIFNYRLPSDWALVP